MLAVLFLFFKTCERMQIEMSGESRRPAELTFFLNRTHKVQFVTFSFVFKKSEAAIALLT